MLIINEIIFIYILLENIFYIYLNFINLKFLLYINSILDLMKIKIY